MLSNSSSRWRKGKDIRKKVLSLLLVLVFSLGLAGCNTLEDAVKKAKPLIPKGYDVVHIEQVSENSGIVFYTYEDQLSAGIFTKTNFGWDWVGSSIGKLISYPEGLQWRYADLSVKGREQQYSVYYGKVDNKDITKIKVNTTNGETANGNIVETAQLKLWYAFVSEPQVPSVNADIIGLSEDGEVLYLFSQPKVNKEDING